MPTDQPQLTQRRDTQVVTTSPEQKLLAPSLIIDKIAVGKVSFEAAYKQLMERWEDPHMTGEVTHDKGGATKYGISQNAYPSISIADLTPQAAKNIAYMDFWKLPKWDINELPDAFQNVANKLFQFGFNCYPGTVIQIANSILFLMQHREGWPKLGEPLEISKLAEVSLLGLLENLASAQFSRYMADYGRLSKVPHSLLDRALCIE